jgi:AbrB family looped-hinge helix DNA binding protein
MPLFSNISVVDERGRAVIPARIRKELGLEKGSRLLWEKVGEHELRVVIIPDTASHRAIDMLGFARRFRPTRRSQEVVRELREGES